MITELYLPMLPKFPRGVASRSWLNKSHEPSAASFLILSRVSDPFLKLNWNKVGHIRKINVHLFIKTDSSFISTIHLLEEITWIYHRSPMNWFSSTGLTKMCPSRDGCGSFIQTKVVSLVPKLTFKLEICKYIFQN